MDVTLTWDELKFAVQVGISRRIHAMQTGTANRYGATNDEGWRRDIESACAEMAVAKAFDVYWAATIGKSNIDVGPYQVRHTERPDGRLILHKPDSNVAQYILVTGVAPRFRLVGWIMGMEGKRDEYWCDPTGGRPAYFVPQRMLVPIHAFEQVAAC